MSETPAIITKVTEFIEKFEASRDPALWQKLIHEELAEVEEAAAQLLKEITDLAYVTAGLIIVAGEEEADRFLDTDEKVNNINRTIGDLIEAFSQEVLDEALNRVHASNMSKLGDDGKPVRREDGKVMKGPNYKPPVLDDLIV